MRTLGEEVAWAGVTSAALCAGGLLVLRGLVGRCGLDSAIRFDQGITR